MASSRASCGAARVPKARNAGPLGRSTITTVAATRPSPSATRGGLRANAADPNPTVNSANASVVHAGTSGLGAAGAGTDSSRASMPPEGRCQVNPGSSRVNSSCERSPSAVHSAAISSGGFDASTLSRSGG